MIRLLTIIGARPQIIKAAALSRAIQTHFAQDIQEDLLHTGQHYDSNMSGVFFEELGIPKPTYQLNVGSAAHGKQTAAMIDGIESVLLEKKYDAVVVYGDTNSTLAGALAAAKIHIPVIHIEAGLRSFNKKMPEEINRIMCDHASTLLYSPTLQGIVNLEKEGISHHPMPWTSDTQAVFHCGDIMYDNSLYFSQRDHGVALKRLGLVDKRFGLCTIHRDTNTDDASNLEAILESLSEITLQHDCDLVLPLHPRTLHKMSEKHRNLLEQAKRIRVIDPLSFLEMIDLEKNCAFIITDSGGVQKEAFFFKKPCVILREQTEWVELVENGNAALAGAVKSKIITSLEMLLERESHMTWPNFFGDGQSSVFICNKIVEFLKD
jgi:UDP-GlcNAc3NAcA epimerase